MLECVGEGRGGEASVWWCVLVRGGEASVWWCVLVRGGEASVW